MAEKIHYMITGEHIEIDVKPFTGCSTCSEN
jgi:hypothetical protein